MKKPSTYINNDWLNILKEDFESENFKKTWDFVEQQYASFQIFPQKKHIFEALNQTSFQNTKVVIVGQDPYHGKGQAQGLAFSVPTGQKLPPSLKNIFKELQADLSIPIPFSGDLTPWAKQGVLLLNATLTVAEKDPGSHQNRGWEQFTDAIIQKLSHEKQNLVFILWGKYAQNKGAQIDSSKHFVIHSAHPSPFSAHRGFFNSRPFSATNKYLESKGIAPIIWSVTL